MPVEVKINSKVYKINCSKDDDNYFINLAKMLNQRITNLKVADPNFFMGLNNETLLIAIAADLLDEIEQLKTQQNNITQSHLQESTEQTLELIEKVKQAIKDTNNANVTIQSINSQLNKIVK